MKARAIPLMESPEQPSLDIEAAFREHHAMVFRAAYRITGSASDAEDALQETSSRFAGRFREVERRAPAATSALSRLRAIVTTT